MPRIRSIKPEFWTNGQVLECSTTARLLFIGLWNFSDDAGRHPYRAKQIKAEIFPADEFTSKDILGMLQELSENGLIRPYEVDGQRYIQITGWHHQRIDKPQPPKCPAPVGDHSGNDPGMVAPDRIGKDRKGKDIGQSQAPDRFADFWAIYPKKVKRQDALRKWKARTLDTRADEIIADVQRRLVHDGRWLDGYVPDPTTYIDGNRWEDALEPPRLNGSSKPDWAQVPHADNDLWPWAKKHGYLNPGDMKYNQYRRALHQAVEQRMEKLRAQISHAELPSAVDSPL